MFPPPQPAALLASQIHRLLDGYVEHPLRYMRERNLQVRLGHLIEAALGPDERLSAVEVLVGSLHSYRTSDRVMRVQHELKIKEAQGQQSDIVLLRNATPADPIQLTRERNGHLDIVAATRAGDAEAVLEIKAACSADPNERRKFRADVTKLHELIQACLREGVQAPECHFVLIDKTMSVREHASCADRKRDLQWDLAEERPWSWAGAGRLGKSHVHVWDFDEGGEVRHRVSVA